MKIEKLSEVSKNLVISYSKNSKDKDFKIIKYSQFEKYKK